MFGNSAVSFPKLRVALAVGLCLLAIAFAVEAKTAWFGPLTGPGSDVQAAKALPADMPRLIEHGIPVPDPVHPAIPFALITTVAIASPFAAPAANEALDNDAPVSLAAYFFPSVFFRPPPFHS
ncbi:MAG TPA: hypothetical protein VL991_14820 [Terracidiphilus sp.]|nr:hypothetical protein [Terracidiphilus sp.]